MGAGGESVPPLSAEQQAVLDGLDRQAEPECAVRTAVRHHAEVALRCRNEDCRNLVLMCRAHAQAAAFVHMGHSIEAVMHGQLPVISCVRCGRSRETLEELVEVVEL